MPVYLAVETSCDETAAAVVRDGRHLLSNSLQTQIDTHKAFGGVVPEVAARQHLQTINFVIADAMSQARLGFQDLSGVAYTAGPGLIGTLLTGLMAAKSISWVYDLPLIAVDHLMAHVCANFIDSELEPPFVTLLVSGGHTQLIFVENYRQFSVLGGTMDDAAGEAYDKVARLLGLGYPGGAVIDKLAQSCSSTSFTFPEANVPGFDFSFSGLKTSVLRCVEKLNRPLPTAEIAAAFQDAAVRALVRKTLAAQAATGAQTIVLAGGVAANSALRARLTSESPVPVVYPPVNLCTDNAAMVAAAAYFCGNEAGLDAGVYSRQPRRRRTVAG